MARTSYHHGALRAAVLSEAAVMVDREGVDGVTLRELARRVGVSHAAPAHHFGDRRGLFTALAVDGFEVLARELADAGNDFRAVALAYVRFAIEHPGHYAVMYRLDLLDPADPTLLAAQANARSALTKGIADLPPERRRGQPADAAVAAWSLVHGFASLWLNSALPSSPLTNDTNPEKLTARIADVLFGPPTASPTTLP